MYTQSEEMGDNHRSQSIMTLNAVTDGEIMPIQEVADDLFSKKMIGNGFAIQPSSETIHAPIGGKIIEIADTKHAYYIETKNQVKILIHIGINTLMLDGEGFTTSVKKNMIVEKGQVLGSFDKELCIEKGFDPVIPVIVLDHPSIKSLNVLANKEAKAKETTALELSIVKDENK